MARGIGAHSILEEINGTPSYETFISMSTTNASYGATPARRYILQSDVDCFIAVNATAVVATALKLLADEKFYLCLPEGTSATINAILVAGTGTLKIFRVS